MMAIMRIIIITLMVAIMMAIMMVPHDGHPTRHHDGPS